MSTTRILEFTGADLRVTKLGVSSNAEVGAANLFVDTLTGRVGLGTTAPTQALDVHGNVTVQKESTLFAGSDVIRQLPKHDRPLTKYPEIVLTAAASYAYQDGYQIQRSSENSSYPAYNLFDGNIATRWLARANGGDTYNASSPYEYTGSNDITTTDGTEHPGAWVRLELPKKIRLAYTKIIDNAEPPNRTPGKITFLGSNDNTDWYFIKEFSGMSPDVREYTYHINETTYYKHYAFVVKNISDGDAALDLGEWELYGTEEGDESVDIVHTSIPNKPGTQHLEVYWDANDTDSYSGSGTTVNDLSGNDITGTISGNAGFDSTYKAWTFDGTGDYITNGAHDASWVTGDFVHSISMWAKVSGTGDAVLFWMGTNTDSQRITLYYLSPTHPTNPNRLLYTFRGNGSYADVPTVYRNGEWFHITATYDGTTNNEALSIYFNGVKLAIELEGTRAALSILDNQFFLGATDTSNGGFNGSISNFRFFTKTLNADQVKELYDYDAPRFGHRTNVLALHKGNLGVGVSAPTSRFEVAGADGLQEYPPKAMTGYETYMEGHGVFRASQSAPYPDANYTAWKVFDKSLAYGAHFLDSYSSTNDYIYDGAGTRSDGLGGFSGDWVMLEMPYAINLKSFAIAPASLARAPEDFVILASNDSTAWTKLINYTGLGSSDWPYAGGYLLKHFTVPIMKEYYRYFAIVVTRTESNDYLQIDAMEYYGTPAPSSLEDGHLTLGKALTAPRVSGHPAGAETPRAESLVVHYDTTVDSVVSGTTVVDTSGNGSNGTLNGDAAYSSSDRALTFDGTGDTVYDSALPNWSDNISHTVSFFVKINSPTSAYAGAPYTIWNTASTANHYSASSFTTGVNGSITFYHFYNDYTYNYPLYAGTWYHIVYVYNGSPTTQKVYVNGASVALSSTAGSSVGDTLVLGTSPKLSLGGDYGRSNYYMDGSISNFKIWNVALTAEEVAADYALGRTGKALNVTDTAVCLGGTVPRAQLDVRGSGLFGGNVGIGTTSPTVKLDVVGGNIGLDYGRAIEVSPNMAYWWASGTTKLIETGWVDGGPGDEVRFFTPGSVSATQKMVINSIGNVGIGTTLPVSNLHTAGKSVFSTNISTQNLARVYDADVSIVKEISYGGSDIVDLDIGATTSAIGNFGSTYRYKLYSNVASYSSKFQIAKVNGPSGTYNGYGTVTDLLTLTSSGDLELGGYVKPSTEGLRMQAEYTNFISDTATAGNTVYEGIPTGTLTTNATYFVVLRWGPTASPYTPWEAKATTFLECISTNTAYSNGADWIPLNTATHDANGGDFTISVRTKGGSGTTSGLEYKVDSSYATGSWTISAYRVV